MARNLNTRLTYFTVEDEGILAEAFSEFEKEVFAITYKVTGTEDVFVTTKRDQGGDGPARRALQPARRRGRREDPALPLAAVARGTGRLEDAVKALALANRAIALACVGVNGETNLGFDLSNGPKNYTYFTAPAGHTFIMRLFFDRKEAVKFLEKLTMRRHQGGRVGEVDSARRASELKSYH